MCAPAAGTSLPPGTPTIPLSQLQHHSLALQGQHGQTLATASQPQQGQQAVFRFPAAVSLTGDLLCMLPRLCLLLLISHVANLKRSMHFIIKREDFQTQSNIW